MANTGGKGASLGEMARVGLPIPPGFVVLAGAFERFLEKTDLNVEVDAILDTVNHQEMHTVEHASEKIQALILAEEIPKILRRNSRNSKSSIPYVAVRSSHSRRQLVRHGRGSLTVFSTRPRLILKNVQKCWASLLRPGDFLRF